MLLVPGQLRSATLVPFFLSKGSLKKHSLDKCNMFATFQDIQFIFSSIVLFIVPMISADLICLLPGVNCSKKNSTQSSPEEVHGSYVKGKDIDFAQHVYILVYPSNSILFSPFLPPSISSSLPASFIPFLLPSYLLSSFISFLLVFSVWGDSDSSNFCLCSFLFFNL